MGLGISITVSPERKPSDHQNFNLGHEIGIDEWEALFHEELKMPEFFSTEGESFNEFENRRAKTFQDLMSRKGYIMLGRICYIFRDTFYQPSEVSELLDECASLREHITHDLAINALDALIEACGEALKVNSGIWLVSD
jgi:hypothetical protein